MRKSFENRFGENQISRQPKTEMKKYQLLFALLITFLFSVIGAAQCLPPVFCIADKQVTTASTQIAVQIPDNLPITKIRLNNEAITNTLKGLVMWLDGSTPFPVGKAGFLYLFGLVNMRMSRNKETTPTFFLEPTTGATLTSADAIVLPLNRLPFQIKDRDVFRIGVGVDVFKLFKKDDAPK